MYKTFAKLFIPDIYERAQRQEMNGIVRFFAVYFNPITLFTIFLLLRVNNWIGGEDFQIPDQERVSNVSYLKLCSYIFFPNLTLYYWEQLSFSQVIVNYVLGIPDFMILIYHIYANNITFSGIKYLLWLLYNVISIFGFISFAVDMFTYDISKLEEERTHSRLVNDELNRRNDQFQLFFDNFYESSQISKVKEGFDHLSNMNLTQLKYHKKRLKNDLRNVGKEIKQKIPKQTQPVNVSNTYQATNDLKSKNCILCLSNPPVYRFVPCYHCCLCEDCVYEQHYNNKNSLDLAADYNDNGNDDQILSDDDYNLTTNVEKYDLSQYHDDNNFVKCDLSLTPSGHFMRCPICKKKADLLEYVNLGFKPHVNVQNYNSQYHVNGHLRGSKETEKLLKHYLKNRSDLSKLSQSAKVFVMKAILMLKK